MSPKIIINRIELGFWNTVTPIMQNSKPVRKITPVVYKWINWAFVTKTIYPMVYLAIIGLFFGYLLGITTQFL